jgi:N-acetyl-gamma-glutamyl-phosphate reductase
MIMNRHIKAGIIGGAGYTGGELIRLLVNHPQAEISFIHSKSNAGNPVHAVHHDLLGETGLKFTDTLKTDVDVLFLCSGHGESRKFLEENPFPEKVRVIDLSNDFRLSESARSGTRKFLYGLPELNRDHIRNNRHIDIANPGCFATAIQLGLLPLAKEGLLDTIQVTGITGSTGAGQGFNQTSHFSWRANNIQAYKTLTHQHLGEIGESLKQLQPSPEPEINFIPWRGDFTRGIFVSSMVSSNRKLDELFELFETYYELHPFTYISREPIYLKQVVNTNKAIIHLEKVGSKLVIHSTIDNLLKGASGQAVQNMNLLFGLDERTGLHLKANYF